MYQVYSRTGNCNGHCGESRKEDRELYGEDAKAVGLEWLCAERRKVYVCEYAMLFAPERLQLRGLGEELYRLV